jgi:phosphoribosylanthranilate isomerase
MTRVKICGICRPEDAAAAAAAGATAIGLVFWPDSPRAVDTDTARRIVAALPAGVPAIGVFVNQPVGEINAAIDAAGLFGVQLHGDEALSIIPQIRRPVVRAMTLAQEEEIALVPSSVTVLLDAHDAIRRGGTGQTIDWHRAAAVARTREVVLAGGLTPSNVGDAVRKVAPYAVDVSSGVERSPRKKDASLMRAFVETVAAVDAEVRA